MTGNILTSMTLKRKIVMNNYLWAELYFDIGVINGALMLWTPNWVSGISTAFCVVMAVVMYTKARIDKRNSNERGD